MKMMKLAFVGALVGCALPVIAEPISFSPGEWKGVVSGTVNGQSMTNETVQDCMSADENTVSASDLEEMMGDSFDCSYSNVNRTSSQITADVMCNLEAEGMVYNGKSVVNYTKTDFSMTLTGALSAGSGIEIPAGMTVSANQISPICQ